MKEFDNFEEAFDYCREKNAPVIIGVKKAKGYTYKLFPSGLAVVHSIKARVVLKVVKKMEVTR